MKRYRYKKMVEGTLKGDAQAITNLYQNLLEATGTAILSYVRKNIGTKEDAEDLFEEAFFQFVIRIKDSRFGTKHSFSCG